MKKANPAATIQPGNIGHDFELSDKIPSRTHCLICGSTGSGKTTFVTDYCPEPVYLINLDGRSGPAVANARSKGRTIHHAQLLKGTDLSKVYMTDGNRKKEDIDMDKEVAEAVVRRVVANVEYAVQQSQLNGGGTLAIDTVYELGLIYNIAVSGSPIATMNDYGKGKFLVNYRLLALFSLIRSGNFNFVGLSRERAIWQDIIKKGKKVREQTGDYEPRCLDPFCEEADWIARIAVDMPDKSQLPSKRKPASFSLEMLNPKVKISEASKIYTQDEWSMLGPFAYACAQLYPNQDMSVWM